MVWIEAFASALPGELNVLDERYRDRVLDALAPYLVDSSGALPTEDTGVLRAGPGLPPSVEDDIATNRPGHAVEAPPRRPRLGRRSVKIGGQSYPYVRKSRAEARRASSALTKACGFAVDVRPVLVFVDADRLTVAPTLHDVRVVRHRELTAVKRAAGVCTAAEVEGIYAAARNRRIWVGN